MKQRLTERYIIDLMKEEWTKKVHSLLEKKKEDEADSLEVNVDIDGDGTKENVISPGLKVVDVSGPMPGIVYDVISSDGNTFTLSRADLQGTKKVTTTITKQDFQTNYKRK